MDENKVMDEIQDAMESLASEEGVTVYKMDPEEKSNKLNLGAIALVAAATVGGFFLVKKGITFVGGLLKKKNASDSEEDYDDDSDDWNEDWDQYLDDDDSEDLASEEVNPVETE